jgi:hypothetical protein
MTQDEYNEAAALVVRLRKELEHTNQHLVAHIDALTKSNAQCAEYLRQNEQLHSELVDVRAALASVSEERDSLKRTLQEWEEAETKPHARVTADDVADHVVPPVLPLCNVCHGCGSVLYPSPAGDYFGCGDVRCTRSNTKHWHPGCTIGPYAGPCKSTTPVRHE